MNRISAIRGRTWRFASHIVAMLHNPSQIPAIRARHAVSRGICRRTTNMTDNQTLEVEEGRRIEQYDAMKNAARTEIQQKTQEQAEELTPNEQGRVERLGNRFKNEAITEVQETEKEVKRARGTARTSQVIDYIFYLIYVVIGLRIIFDLFGARESNAFDNFVDAVSSPFLAPFHNLFPDPVSGRFQLRFSYLAALGIYVVLHLTINGFLRMLAHRKTEV